MINQPLGFTSLRRTAPKRFLLTISQLTKTDKTTKTNKTTRKQIHTHQQQQKKKSSFAKQDNLQQKTMKFSTAFDFFLASTTILSCYPTGVTGQAQTVDGTKSKVFNEYNILGKLKKGRGFDDIIEKGNKKYMGGGFIDEFYMFLALDADFKTSKLAKIPLVRDCMFNCSFLHFIFG